MLIESKGGATMSFKERVVAALRLPIVVSRQRSCQDEARRFLKSPESKRVPLREFERRYGIDKTDGATKMQGYPKSSYYRPEDDAEIRRNKKATDKYLGDDA